MRPVIPQARAICSITSTTSSSGRSPPPWAAGIVMPMKPAAARSLTLSHGYSSVGVPAGGALGEDRIGQLAGARPQRLLLGVSGKLMSASVPDGGANQM